jgi:hypothetical protein
VLDTRKAFFFVVADEAHAVFLRHLDKGDAAVVQAGC